MKLTNIWFRDIVQGGSRVDIAYVMTLYEKLVPAIEPTTTSPFSHVTIPINRLYATCIAAR